MSTLTITPSITNQIVNVADAMFSYFQNIKGTRMMTLTLNTEPKLSKPKSNPLAGRVRKISKVNGAVGFSYANAVNRQRDKDESTDDVFEPNLRPNMVKSGGATITHEKTGQRYVYLRPLHDYPAIYYVDGKLTPIDEIREYLYFPPKRKDGGSQKVTKEVQYRNIKIENIVHYKG